MQSYYGKAVRGQTGGLLGRLLPTPAGGYIKRLMDVLVVEDDADARAAMAKALTASGFTVTEADNGLVGLQHVSQRRFDAIVCDLMMPRMSGYELIDRLAELPKRPAVIVVTALPEGAHARLNSAVVSSILQKPFEIGLLTAVLLELAATHERSDSGANVVDFPRSN